MVEGGSELLLHQLAHDGIHCPPVLLQSTHTVAPRDEKRGGGRAEVVSCRLRGASQSCRSHFLRASATATATATGRPMPESSACAPLVCATARCPCALPYCAVICVPPRPFVCARPNSSAPLNCTTAGQRAHTQAAQSSSHCNLRSARSLIRCLAFLTQSERAASPAALALFLPLSFSSSSSSARSPLRPSDLASRSKSLSRSLFRTQAEASE